MDIDELLKGNYKIPPEQEKMCEEGESKEPDTTTGDPLQQEFEAAAIKKLGGSITFVKDRGGFTWRGKKKETKNE